MAPNKDQIITSALAKFLRQHNAEPPEGTIDDIVLSYVVSILEDVGSDDDPESFDVEGFSEVMEAYIPGFGEIDNGLICDWIFHLVEKLRSKESINGTSCVTAAEISLAKLSLSQMNGSSQPVQPPCGRPRKNSRKNSGSQSGEEAHSSKTVQDAPLQNGHGESDLNLLREMFPAASSLEISHCLCVAKGKLDDAIPLILHRQETGEAIKESFPQPSGAQKSESLLNDDQMKESILNKYSYVDTEDDRREHHPSMALQNKSSKKLIRYLDSKVVSTKGERFTEVKRDDEVDPKQFNVNLKPARQYRFH